MTFPQVFKKISLVNYLKTHSHQSVRNFSLVNFTDTTGYGGTLAHSVVPESLTPSEHIPTTEVYKSVAGYSLGKTLGWGRFGIVRDISLLPNGTLPKSPLAMKMLNIKVHPKVCNNEANIYSRLMNLTGSKRNFTTPVEILKHFDPQNKSSTLCIVFERLDGSDLFDTIAAQESLSEETTKTIVSQMVLAIEQLHENRIIHRDIKPENVLFRLDSSNEIVLDEPVLTDFGLSYVIGSDDIVNKPAGTFGYASPEILSGSLLPKTHRLFSPIWTSDYDSSAKEIESLKMKTDVWSLGVLLYACISGEFPFPTPMTGETTVEEHLEAAFNGPKFDSPCWSQVSPMCVDIISKMLQFDPESRPSVSQLRLHPWFRGE